MLDAAGWGAIRLSLLLASATTGLLVLLGTPLAWWVARGHSRWRIPIRALIALPLVLPPTVLGFYLLLALGPRGVGGWLAPITGVPTLAFSFTGLLIGSLLYSLPFVLQPLINAFETLPRRHLDAAASLRAGPLDRFFHIVLPLCRPAYTTAAVMGFAHTLGEFGVVLMVGGNIAGQTRVISVQLFDHVEALEYTQAHWLAGGMLVFSFAVLFALQCNQARQAVAAD